MGYPHGMAHLSVDTWVGCVFEVQGPGQVCVCDSLSPGYVPESRGENSVCKQKGCVGLSPQKYRSLVQGHRPWRCWVQVVLILCRWKCWALAAGLPPGQCHEGELAVACTRCEWTRQISKSFCFQALVSVLGNLSAPWTMAECPRAR